MNQKSMGQFIAALRKANGMTQKQLAEKLNVSDKAVSRWERDENAPDLSLIPVMAELFGVTSDELLRGERRNPHTATPDAASSRTEKQLEKLLNTVRSKSLTGRIIAIGLAAAGLLISRFARAFLSFQAVYIIQGVLSFTAIIFEIVVAVNLFFSVHTSDFEGEKTDLCKRSLFRSTGYTIIAILALWAFDLPWSIVSSRYPLLFVDPPITGYLLVNINGCLAVTLLGLVVLWLAERLAVKKGLYSLPVRKGDRALRLHSLQKKCGIAFGAIVGVLLITQLLFDCFISPWSLLPPDSGQTFTDTAAFTKYIETFDMPDVTLSDQRLESTFYLDYEAETVCAPDGSPTLTYVHRNGKVVNVRFSWDGNTLSSVTTYDRDDLMYGLWRKSAFNTIWLAAYPLTAVITGIVYLIRKKKLR